MHEGIERPFGWEPNKYSHDSFIVSCPKCKSFDTIHVRIYGHVYIVEESGHYFRRGDDIIHSPCDRVCTNTGKRFLSNLKVNGGML